jgi:uncharacterized protein YceH (UPF0502 family)
MDTPNTPLQTPPPPTGLTLTADEARVLGVLIEKQITTPEYYPLTLNALIAACNQKSNRDPVLALDETAVVLALDELREKKLAWQVSLAGHRAYKYRHAFTEVFHVSEMCVPLLTELLLRGPQTAAELRARTERMHAVFADVADVEAALQGLADHADGPLTVKLARESGRREARWAHLLSGQPTAATPPSGAGSDAVSPPVTASAVSRLDRLEQELAAVREHVTGLEARLAAFVRQFSE